MADSGWRETTIGVLCDDGVLHTQTGPFGSQLHSYDYVPRGIPVVPTEGIGRRHLLTEGIPEVTEETAARLARHRLMAGDILFARRGVQATGLSAIVTRKQHGWLCGTGAILLRVTGKNIDPEFLSFLLSAEESVLWLKQHAVGAVMPNLNEGVIRRLPLTLPPIAEQRAIAAVLGALDDKIELNRRMNATLEAMARTLFQSWFVDFDPVRAKLDGRVPFGLGSAIEALFPDHLEETSLGHTPTGWEVRSLDRTAHYLNGLALQKYPAGDGRTLPVIKIAQLRKGDSRGADRCNSDVPPAYIVQDGDVLFSWSGSLEVELWCGGSGALNQHLFKVTSPEFPKWFYYLWTLYYLDEFRLIAADKATTMGHIQRGHLDAAKVLVPPNPLLNAMSGVMSPLISQIIANRIQSRTLATLRDTLLPKLLSGELSVAVRNNPEFPESSNRDGQTP
jgi:type I restriction enzyme, S subunit